MKAKNSVLIMDSFSVLESECSLIPWSKDASEERHLNHSVDIDFDVMKHKEDENKHIILITLRVNPEKEPGYYACVKGLGAFDIADSSVSEKEKNQLVLFSGVSICVTQLRSFIANLTSYYPLGKYSFPAIDINDLIKQKKEQLLVKGKE